MRIIRLTDLPEGAKAARKAETIFWQSAGTRQFVEERERATYHDLWFGRYRDHAPGEFFIALDKAGDVAGYLAGALISNAPPLPGPDYYTLFPAELIARHPAHLHVNVRAGVRGVGGGAALVRAFAEHCRARGAPGLHAVTAQGARAAAFFAKCGLAPCAAADWRGRALVFLGRRFAD